MTSLVRLSCVLFLGTSLAACGNEISGGTGGEGGGKTTTTTTVGPGGGMTTSSVSTGSTGCEPFGSPIPCVDGSTYCDDTGLPHCPQDPALPTCEVFPPGAPFTFKIHNVGERHLRLAFGCGKAIPIEVNGDPISAGQVDSCELDCASVTPETPAPGCSDCGPGVGALLEPGATVEIPWNRLSYAERAYVPSCSGNPFVQTCGLGRNLVAELGPPFNLGAELTFCSDVGGEPGYCGTAETTYGQQPNYDFGGDSIDFEVQ